MEKNIEIKLLEYAQYIAGQYETRISPEQYKQLCDAIKVCHDYYINGIGDWGVMYNAVLDEDGIWEYSELYDLEEEIKNMWGLETRILMCASYIGCTREQDYIPQDMELRGENIPAFVEYLENNISECADLKPIIDFWDRNLCY